MTGTRIFTTSSFIIEALGNSQTMFFLVPSFLYAHGIRGKTATGGVVVSAEYDTGEPMSYVKVSISAPEAKLSFQSGRTDRNGRFCFF